MVGKEGFEPSTARVSDENSNQLSYLPLIYKLATHKGIEPLSPDRQSGIIAVILMSRINKLILVQVVGR